MLYARPHANDRAQHSTPACGSRMATCQRSATLTVKPVADRIGSIPHTETIRGMTYITYH